MKIYNTLSRRVEELKPIKKDTVSMYNCGPTVYMHMHIGNVRAYLFVDVLRRALDYLGYEVEQVMNLTDVGHLSSDSDEGEDKMEKAAEREEKDIWKIAEFYIDSVKSDFEEMNYLTPKIFVRATDHIDEMIDMVQKIEENGYAYETDRALYFDVQKLPDYTLLQGGQPLDEKNVGVRDDVNVDPDKKHPADFALWMKCVGPHKNHIMRWESPWGVGFPGWHIECSAMGTKYLGTKFDIHTGGEDHISVHHPNERAQNIGAFGEPSVTYWVHNMFLQIDGGKMGKSLGNMYELSDIKKKGYHPLDLRYFFLSANYRTKQNFTWKNLGAAKSTREKLLKTLKELRDSGNGKIGNISKYYKNTFEETLNDNLNTPESLATVWTLLKDTEIKPEDKIATVLEFDRVLGLKLEDELKETKMSPEKRMKIEKLVEQREDARSKKDWDKSDRLREKILKLGVTVEDTKDGPVLSSA